MSTARRTPAEPGPGRQPATPLNPGPRPGEKDTPETAEPYDPPFPDCWPTGRPEYVIVVDQLRGWRPDLPPPSPSSWKPGPPAPANPSQTQKPNHDPDPEVTAMTLTISDTTMTSDQTLHSARQAPSRDGWEVSWLPGQVLDRNTAITAMTLADIAGSGDLPEGHRLWPHIQGWAAELGLTGPDAITRASQPPASPRHRHDQEGDRTDLEAGQ